MKRTACLSLLGLPLLAAAQSSIPVQSGGGVIPRDDSGFTRIGSPVVRSEVTTDPLATPEPSPDPLVELRYIRAGTLVNGADNFATTGLGTDGSAVAANGTSITPGIGVVDGGGAGTGPDPAADRISNALSAAPPAVSANATVMDFATVTGGQSTVLRSGNNGWTCFPDNPATPGNDPVCLDRQWMTWLEAFREQRAPLVTGPGLAYRLQGASLASSTDPFATAPAAGQTWTALPPHLMLLSPQRWDATVYPAERDLTAGGPWIVFGNSPYEHLVVPVPTAAGGGGLPATAPGSPSTAPAGATPLP